MARRAGAIALVLVIALAAALFAFESVGGRFGPGERTAPAGSTTPTVSAAVGLASPRTATPATSATPPVDADGLRTIGRTALPKEARLTLDLIAVGGPFPHSQDGSTYRNLERILPTRPAEYYREYTVETPGSPDRGARRIVVGRGGESYWTTDHYATFRRILP